MSLVEFIGFIVSLIAIFYAFFKKGYDEYKRQQDPERYEKERKEAEVEFKRFLKTMDIKLEDEIEVPPPPKKVVEKLKPIPTKHLKTRSVQSTSSLFTEAQEAEIKADRKAVLRLRGYMERFEMPRDMILLSEIIGPPKGLK